MSQVWGLRMVSGAEAGKVRTGDPQGLRGSTVYRGPGELSEGVETGFAGDEPLLWALYVNQEGALVILDDFKQSQIIC